MTRISAAQARKLLAKPKRSKYRAVAVVVDGIRFDSKAEAIHYATLIQQRRYTKIVDLKVHPRFDLHALSGKKVGVYEADFTFWDDDGELRVQDVKGVMTPLARRNIAHFEAEYGITVELIQAKRSGRA